ncbi:MAG TPA: dephospho-CoA kinase [Woeseiaceae bacterium]|nr:dephospho-CoA kinase [Woeseiaceae bacterium]
MDEKDPLRIGLTGGIASGKSMIADMFAARGVPIIDTDVIAREVVQPGEPALNEIERQFGPEVISPDGRLDRRRLREIVFSDDGKREELEAILHPRIRDAAVLQSSAAGGEYQVIVVPLLVESPMRQWMDRILVVDCSEETQLQRLLERDAESREQARRMIRAQASREERLAIADDVIGNDRTKAEADDQVENLHRFYRGLANAAHG